MFFFFMLRRPPVSTCTPTRSLHYALPIFLFGDGDDFARQFAGDLRLLIPERATAVCSPGFRSRFGPFGRIEELLRVPLIHLEGDSGERWFTWQSWFTQAGIAYRPAALGRASGRDRVVPYV